MYNTKKKISDFLGDSGLNIPQETLVKFISTKAFSKINTTWDERILELRDFKKEYGHFNITNLHKNKYRLLYRWVNKIRKI